MAADDEARFIQSCASAAEYPRNVVYHNSYDYLLVAYAEHLDEQERRLFCDESKAVVHTREYDQTKRAFESFCARSLPDWQGHLAGSQMLDRLDPKCRFVFIEAPNSRERLNISRRMLVFTLSYHQVMPAFLDFMFSFGRQQYAQDFHFSGFRHNTHLNTSEKALNISKLGRSGRDFHMCYNLKSVERYPGAPHWPWSIRQMAVYHSLDIESGNSFWIILKANQLMKERIESATKDGLCSGMSSFDNLTEVFASSLSAQLLLCNWCAENWRWYINFLEETLREATGRAAIKIYKVPDPAPSADFHATLSRRTFSGNTLTDSTPLQAPMFPPPPPFTPPQGSRPPQVLPPLPTSLPKVGSDGDDFSFNDLQRVQHIEDKANEMLLVLDANPHVLTEIKKYYEFVTLSEVLPAELRSSWKAEFNKFDIRISSIINDLQMQYSRAKTLLKMLEDRKNLLYGILEYQNIQTSRLLSTRAQQSARRMEAMTLDMHQIAQKTKQETVSMRIITLVTLFFLPGTFISTIMSTDIIHFNRDPTSGLSMKIFQLGALQLYLAITVPFMVVTFIAWYVVYLYVDKAQEARAERLRLQAEELGKGAQ